MHTRKLRQGLDTDESRKLYSALFGRSTSAGSDIRGFVVLDRNHRKVGTICEVYSDRDTLKPRYVEIVPFNCRIDRSIVYPYDFVKCISDDGPAFVSTTTESLLAHEEYELEHIMQSEGENLVTFNDVLEADSRDLLLYREYQTCA